VTSSIYENRDLALDIKVAAGDSRKFHEYLRSSKFKPAYMEWRWVCYGNSELSSFKRHLPPVPIVKLGRIDKVTDIRTIIGQIRLSGLSVFSGMSMLLDTAAAMFARLKIDNRVFTKGR
jgi:hypothetical protein